MTWRDQRSTDAYEVKAVLARYCRGVDRLDAELLRGCFHPTAQEMRDGVLLERDRFIDALVERSTRRYETVMHFIGNIWIEFTDADRARSETYVVAYSIGIDRGDPNMNRIAGVRYIDDFERRDDQEWRIAARTVVSDWILPQPLQTAEHSPRGRRDRTDPSYL